MAKEEDDPGPPHQGMIRARELIEQEYKDRTGFLDLGRLGLSELPPELFRLEHLKGLNLGSAYFDFSGEWRESAGEFGDNTIQFLPDQIAVLKQLTHFSCENTPVSDLTPLTGLTALQTLDCAGSQVSDLTPLKGLPALQTLECAGSQVSDLTPLKGLTALQSLDCAGSQVSDLTPLTGLSALQTLRCSGSKVSDLTPLKGLTALQTLTCSHSPVSDLTPLTGLSALQYLDCYDSQVSDLTPLTGLSALQTLRCSGSQVSDLTPLKGLTALQTLECDRSQVSDLTPLTGLSALQTLDCSGSQVSDLTPLTGLSALQTLTCSRSPVSDLTPLTGLSALQTLTCSRSPVSDLTPLTGLTALQTLDCSYSSVSDLTPLTGLSALQTLDCDNTNVTAIPGELVFQDSMMRLFLYNTKIRDIPAEALSKSYADNCLGRLRAHLMDLKAGSEKILATKLLVLGNGRVGKTQLCRVLNHERFIENAESTHGIVIQDIPWPKSGKGETVNLWDFGGQDIYHGTHALFLKTRASFLVVWHPDFEAGSGQDAHGVEYRNEPLAYWMEYLHTLANPDSRILIVQTRCDRPEQERRKLSLDDASLERCWKSLHFSARTKRGEVPLRKAITDAIRDIHEKEGTVKIGKGRMEVWRTLKQWLAEDQKLPRDKRQHRVVTLNEFKALCEQARNISSPEMLLHYLHDVGAVFYRKELFHGKIILDQTWALEAIYAVFDRRNKCPQLLGACGWFTRPLLEAVVWKNYQPAEQQLFLSMMESCGICFVRRKADEARGQEAEYVAPDLLPDRAGIEHQMSGRWDDSVKARRLEFEYPFLHQGLMRSLICDVGKFAGDAGVYWKYGAWVFEKETGCRVLMEQKMGEGQGGRIIFQLQGDRGGRIADWLREQIEARNRLFGYPDLLPVEDEFPSEKRPSAREVGSGDPAMTPGALGAARVNAEKEAVATPPVFGRMPPTWFVSKAPQVYVSYAWEDKTLEGIQRGQLVDDLCAAMEKAGKHILRDKDELKPGDRISEFMDRLVEGDFIICIISKKYLHSPYCMYELFNIHRRCGGRKDEFLNKVIPLILPDASLKTMAERLEYSFYWINEVEEVDELLRDNGENAVSIMSIMSIMSVEEFRNYKLMLEFASKTSEILGLLVDKVMPRDLEMMKRDGFREILGLITSR